MNQSLLLLLTVSKILLFGYALDLFMYRSFLFQRSWFTILVILLLTSGIRFIFNFKLLRLKEKNSLTSLSVSAIIGILINFFTTGDPIFDSIKSLTGNQKIAFLLIIGGISLILIETISLQLLSGNRRIDDSKTQILDDLSHE